MFGKFGKKSSSSPEPTLTVSATETADKRVVGRFAIDSREELYRCEESDKIADDILATAQSLAATKSSGETFSVALLSDHPEVHHQQIFLSLAMKPPDETGLLLGVAFNNRFEFTKL